MTLKYGCRKQIVTESRTSSRNASALLFAAMSLAALLIFPDASRGQSNEQCLVCHSNPDLETVKNGRRISLYVSGERLQASVHSFLNCTDCHTGLNPNEIPHAKVIEPVHCQTCHDMGDYDHSVHGTALGPYGCSDCHGTHYILPPDNTDSRVNRIHLAATCGHCHQTEDLRYSESAHGLALVSRVAAAPSCIDCHKEVHTMPPIDSEASPLYKPKSAAVCLACHIDKPEVRQLVGISTGFIADFEQSIHGRLIAQGILDAATCTNCHGAHEVLGAADPDSRVNKFSIPRTCGECHGKIAVTYYKSIHGTALKEGIAQAPNCTDCHGEHQIFSPNNPRSRVAKRNVSSVVCGACHESLPLNRKYGLASERFKTYEDSYHGLAVRAGAVEVANCASCHGYHDILPASNPDSSVNKKNLPKTCGKCHKGASESFTEGKVHLLITPVTQPILFWISSFYVALIVFTIGGMFLHNAFDFSAKSKEILAARRHGLAHEAPPGSERFLRMNLNERIQHYILTGTLIILVLTGFALKFPDAWWVAPVRSWSRVFFEARGVVHRAAGGLLIATAFYHIYYVSFRPRGRRLFRDLFPAMNDFRDLRDAFRYYVGLSKTRPKFGRFAYPEKVEYWALIWGVGLMSATGIILWFENFFIGRLTLLGWNVALTIHYYEAWLAMLAILFWHFYFTIFNPNVYPMNMAWIAGYLTEEEMAVEHPLELERIRSEQIQKDIDEKKQPPPSPPEEGSG